ncbi:MAG: cytochrome c1 [Arenicellales bacterium]
MTSDVTRTVDAGRRIAAAILVAALLVPPAAARTRNTQPPLDHMTVDLRDRSALRDGALAFTHQCIACHSMKGQRFAELAKPLGLDRESIQTYLNTTGRGYLDTMISGMPHDVAGKFLHKQPPDLTVIAKRRSVDWLYTYLKSFYLDPSRPTGTNNVVFHNVAMPDVFAGLQGLQEPVTRTGYRNGSKQQVAVGTKLVEAGSLSPARFDTMVRDLVSFLYYSAHPHALERRYVGEWAVAVFAVLSILTWLLYRLHWRRVVPPEGGRWWRYWK